MGDVVRAQSAERDAERQHAENEDPLHVCVSRRSHRSDLIPVPGARAGIAPSWHLFSLPTAQRISSGIYGTSSSSICWARDLPTHRTKPSSNWIRVRNPVSVGRTVSRARVVLCRERLLRPFPVLPDLRPLPAESAARGPSGRQPEKGAEGVVAVGGPEDWTRSIVCVRVVKTSRVPKQNQKFRPRADPAARLAAVHPLLAVADAGGVRW